MNALIGLEDKSKLALSSSGIGLPQPGQPHRQQPRDPGPALRRVRIPSQRDHRDHSKRTWPIPRVFSPEKT